MVKKHLRPQFDDDYDDQEELDFYLKQNEGGSHNEDDDDDDELAKLSFGSLKSAQSKLDDEERSSKPKKALKKKVELKKKEVIKKLPVKQKAPIKTFSNDSDDDSGSQIGDSDSEGSDGSDSEGFFDEDDNEGKGTGSNSTRLKSRSKEGKRGKHAPTETSSKKKVSRIREIPGLVPAKKQSSLYTDIRFDTAFGKADAERIRKDYKFLDDYRNDEIKEINNILKNQKLKSKLSYSEIQELEYRAKSLKSRLDSLKNRDMQKEVIKKYKEEHKGQTKFYLKNSEKKKIIAKHKFENMKASQREKVIERKRKRRLGKEFKQLEFNRPRN